MNASYMKHLLLIDANSLIHRAFHALPPLTSPDGRPTGALYGLASILLKILREEGPRYVAACFDRPEPTFRKEAYADYKAHRPKAPDTLVSQLIEAHTLFLQFGIRTFEEPGLEADDLIASLVARLRRPGLTITILTGDLDALQLVEGREVVVRAPRVGISDTVIYDEQKVKERYGIPPARLPDWKALVGDPSDNIKGAPGIGPKTAASLLSRRGSVEELYRHLEEAPRERARLEQAREQVLLAKHLVTLRRTAEIGVNDVEELRLESRREALAQYFQALGFDTLRRRLEEGSAPSLFGETLK